jgi:putative redox protein
VSVGGDERESLPEGQVIVAESGPGTYTQRVRAGTHDFTADEPIGIGDDMGPSPYDLLLAALGACTSMTLRMYAERRKLPLEHVSVTLTQQRRHAEDCKDSEGRPCSITVIERRIELIGDLDEQQRSKLAEIADKCPVHRTLTGEICVETELVAG